jgi:hypothetical protein
MPAGASADLGRVSVGNIGPEFNTAGEQQFMGLGDGRRLGQGTASGGCGD